VNGEHILLVIQEQYVLTETSTTIIPCLWEI
jgi:hypothetical protein